MKLGAVILCANEWRFMPAVMGQLAKFVGPIVIVRNVRSFAGDLVKLGPIAHPNLTLRCDPVMYGDWPSEHATRNAGLDQLADCDYVFTVDSDEVLLDHDLEVLRELCERNIYSAIATRLVTYWKTPEWRIDPPEKLAACIAVKKGMRFTALRRVADGKMVLAERATCHHLSYVRTNDEMREKLSNFAHAEDVRQHWFTQVWGRWTPSMEDLHPIFPPHYKKAIRDPNPELLRVLNLHGVL